MYSTLTALGGRIVVGVNGSIWSYAALQWAVTEGATTGRSVETVTVGDEDPLPEALRPIDHRLPIKSSIVRCDEPAEGLLTKLNDNDLLVLGNSGRGGIHEAFLGPVAAECVLRAPCPITVVTPGAALHFAPRRSTCSSYRSHRQTFPSLAS